MYAKTALKIETEYCLSMSRRHEIYGSGPFDVFGPLSPLSAISDEGLLLSPLHEDKDGDASHNKDTPTAFLEKQPTRATRSGWSI